MTSLFHVRNGTAAGSAAVSSANPQVVAAIVVGIAVVAASVLVAIPSSQTAAPALLAVLAAVTVFASRPTSDRGTIAAALLAVVAILCVQLAPNAELVQLGRMVVGAIFGGLLVTAGRLVLRRG